MTVSLSYRRTRLAGSVLLGALLGSLAFLPRPALGEVRGVEHLPVGPPRGPAVMSRLDVRRSGVSTLDFPREPKIVWRARIETGIFGDLAVDSTGAIVVASPSGELTQLGPRGRRHFRVTLPGAPLASPAITNDDQRLVLTSSGSLVALDHDGAISWTTQLSWTTPKRAADLLPHPAGGVIAAVDDSVYWVTRSGEIRGETKLPRPAETLLLDERGHLWILTQNGQVMSWDFSTPPRSIAHLGGASHGAMLEGGRLTAIVGNHRLLSTDLASGYVSERAQLKASGLGRAPAALPDGGVLLLTADATVLGFAPNGKESFQVALEPAGSLGPRGIEVLAPVVDEKGTTAIAGESLPLTLVSHDGSVSSVLEAICIDPTSLVPGGRRRLVLACASGPLWAIGEPSETPKNDAHP